METDRAGHFIINLQKRPRGGRRHAIYAKPSTPSFRFYESVLPTVSLVNLFNAFNLFNEPFVVNIA